MKLGIIKAPSTQKAIMEIYQKFGPEAFIYRTHENINGVEVLVGFPGNKNDVWNEENTLEESKNLNEAVAECGENNPSLAKMDIVETELAALNQTVRNLSHQLENLLLKNFSQDKLTTEESNPYAYHLEKMGFSPWFINEFFPKKVKSFPLSGKIKRQDVLKQLGRRIKVEGCEGIFNKGIFALVGPTGSGKTTTILKLAKRALTQFTRQNIAIITTDPDDTHTKSQLLHYCNSMKIELEYAQDQLELAACLEKFRHKHLILIDTYGVSQRDILRIQQLMNLLDMAGENIQVYLTLPCNLQENVLDEIARAFNFKNRRACILTKQDESVTLASVISIVLRYRMLIGYQCFGQNINKHIILATAKDILQNLCQVYPDHQQEIMTENAFITYFKQWKLQKYDLIFSRMSNL